MGRKIFVSSLLLLCGSCLATNPCRPQPSPHQQNYMIGYGSLMQSASRRHTNPDAIYAYPIRIKSFERIWGIHGGHYKTTFLTLLKHKGSILNAVYYPSSRNDMLATDKREYGYCRIKVARKNITALGLKSLGKGTYWVYAQKKPTIEKPNAQYPIAQSYVDIFLGGCIEVGKEYQLPQFAEHCITLTQGWPKENHLSTWVNDRIHPRRPFSIPHISEISTLLRQHFAQYYHHPFDQ